MNSKINPNDILACIIEEKYREIQQTVDSKKRFYKIYQLEGNAIGQIGEKFARNIISKITEIENIKDVIHDEYDIRTCDGITFEIKTARHGRNDTFQFNGINPHYNVDYIICIGICGDEALYRIIKKRNELVYVHEKAKRGWYIKNDDFSKKIVAMNPGNEVNFKLTLAKKNLISIENLLKDLKEILRNR